MSHNWKIPSLSENARMQVAQQYAWHFVKEVLPLLSAMDEREQYSAICFETNRMLEGYGNYLADACDTFQRIANDALACSPTKSFWLAADRTKEPKP